MRLASTLSAACAAATLLVAGAAQADVVWYVHGTFDDGQKLSGTITFDQYDYMSDYSLTTTKGSLPGFTYTPANSYGEGYDTPTQVDRVTYSIPGSIPTFLRIQFANDLGTSAASNPITGGFECQNSWACPAAGNQDGYAVRYLVSGAASLTPGAVPEPATWAIMLLGLGGVGAATRAARRRNAMAYAA
jgi:hypothetical protein